ncbi:MAG TPA: hypothetical protein VFU46_10340 [Gemmatimonadales bacterium]|nr:hypothetical protein [Gemmatimonadales bacterium]
MGGGASPAATARIVHRALCAAVVTFGVVAFGLRAAGAAPAIAVPALRPALLGAAAAALLAGFWFRGRVPPLPTGASEDVWWTANLGRAIPVWALLESSATIALVLHFLAADPLGLLAAAAAFALLLVNGPGRLIDR